ncbi:MAG: WhiB family transcriptional regulator [Aeromicrobium sp.]|uniref:WhiB family transcriptional regulator n=1 Tax=Aeromicrobium sp. TaxID=1871063 RepID=UPI003C58120A
MAEISRLPAPIQEAYEWQYEGACRTVDPETFFSPDAERGPRRRTREANAKALCAVCPVLQQCRAHALQVQEPYGVWGGLTINERAEIIANARRAGSRRAG